MCGDPTGLGYSSAVLEVSSLLVAEGSCSHITFWILSLLSTLWGEEMLFGPRTIFKKAKTKLVFINYISERVIVNKRYCYSY